MNNEVWTHGYNSCLHVAISALNHLSLHPRPSGGQEAYNAEHLLQIADEIKRTIAHNVKVAGTGVPAQGTPWQPIETAPKDRFIFVYCPEDNSRWLVRWQGGEWYGTDADHGIRRTGYSFGDPNVVTGWAVTHWTDSPAFTSTDGCPPPNPILKQCDDLHDLGFEGGWKAATEECAKIAEARAAEVRVKAQACKSTPSAQSWFARSIEARCIAAKIRASALSSTECGEGK